MAGTIPFGCGQCLPCRINRARMWTWRQYFEGLCHVENCFVTLTYDSAHIAGNWQLVPRHLQLFIKRLRQCLPDNPIRYFAVGEYGERHRRPHYHLSLFGVSGTTVVAVGSQVKIVSQIIDECWGYGFTSIYEFNHLTAQYVAGYVTKKLTDRRDNNDWNVAEFARMSNRPGIGAGAMKEIARTLLDNYTDWSTGDVPGVISIGKRRIPLGRYLLHRLRTEVGFSDKYTQEIRSRVSMERSVEMQALLHHSKGNTFKAAFLSDIEGQLIQTEARFQRFQRRNII